LPWLLEIEKCLSLVLSVNGKFFITSVIRDIFYEDLNVIIIIIIIIIMFLKG